MKTTKITCLALILTTFSISCKKNHTATDSSAKNDANYLHCKVNGVPHEYNGILSQSGFTASIFTKENGVALDSNNDGYWRVCIHASDYDDYNDAFYMYVPIDNYESVSFSAPELNKQYHLTNHLLQSEYLIRNGGRYPTYIADTVRSTVIFTRFDNKVISGTFEFYGQNPDNKTIALTDGVFKVSY